MVSFLECSRQPVATLLIGLFFSQLAWAVRPSLKDDESAAPADRRVADIPEESTAAFAFGGKGLNAFTRMDSSLERVRSVRADLEQRKAFSLARPLRVQSPHEFLSSPEATSDELRRHGVMPVPTSHDIEARHEELMFKRAGKPPIASSLVQLKGPEDPPFQKDAIDPPLQKDAINLADDASQTEEQSGCKDINKMSKSAMKKHLAGIGGALSDAIVAERQEGGNFLNYLDLKTRMMTHFNQNGNMYWDGATGLEAGLERNGAVLCAPFDSKSQDEFKEETRSRDHKGAEETLDKGGSQTGHDILPHVPAKIVTAAKLDEDFGKAEVASKTDQHYPKEPHADESDEAMQGKTAPWRETMDEVTKHRKAKEDYWNNQLQKVVTDNAVPTKVNQGGGKEYNEYLAKVMSLDPGSVEKVSKAAKDAATANWHADQYGYEYIDDLMKLANSTAAGYNQMGTEHFYGYDQIQGQIVEGHMAPGKAIRLLFPMGSHLMFKSRSGEFMPKSLEYLKKTFAPHVESVLKKYRGMHFTFCVHTSSDMKANDTLAPDWGQPGAGKALDPATGDPPPDTVRKLLDVRSVSLQREIEQLMRDDIGLKLRDEEFHFPPPSDDMRKFEAEMPAGAVLVIAEDRLHRDDYRGDGSEEDLKRHQDEVTAFDQTKCSNKDFEAYQGGQFENGIQPILATAPFQNLPKDQEAMVKPENQEGRRLVKDYEERNREAQALAHDELVKNERVSHEEAQKLNEIGGASRRGYQNGGGGEGNHEKAWTPQPSNNEDTQSAPLPGQSGRDFGGKERPDTNSV